MHARLNELARRHQARLEALTSVRRVQANLATELRATLSEQAGPARTPDSVWDKVCALFVVEAPPAVRVDAVWAHHESATRAVRAVHHHTELLGADLALIDTDLAVLRVEWDALNRGAAGRAHTPDEERFRDLLGLVQELRDTVVQLLGDLKDLDLAGSAALEAMDLHIRWLRKTHGSSPRDPAALERLRQSMQWVCTLASTSGQHADQHVDALDARLRALDRDAVERHRALREVECALEDA